MSEYLAVVALVYLAGYAMGWLQLTLLAHYWLLTRGAESLCAVPVDFVNSQHKRLN